MLRTIPEARGGPKGGGGSPSAGAPDFLPDLPAVALSEPVSAHPERAQLARQPGQQVQPPYYGAVHLGAAAGKVQRHVPLLLAPSRVYHSALKRREKRVIGP